MKIFENSPERQLVATLMPIFLRIVARVFSVELAIMALLNVLDVRGIWYAVLDPVLLAAITGDSFRSS